ncbi:MAG: domain containing protein [Planctomycetaceae bacterium]|nr:domain containing protein [Planctomycetaceae bacterium]
MAQSSEEDFNPFAAPESDLAPEDFGEPEPGPQYAGFHLRFIAEFIDGVIVRIVLFVSGLIFMGGISEIDKVINTPGTLFIIFCMMFVWLYYALQESSAAQATFGKRLLGMRVLDLSGQRITFARATARCFGKIVSYVPPACFVQLFTKRRQALHDILAGTIVVKGK